MNPRSHTLFHFTSSLDNIFKILSSGLWPRYCAEDFRWYNEAIDYVAYPMVCFCDIPLTRISEHTQFYGQFGIGFKRDWAIKSGLNPVIYLAENSPLRKSLLQMAHSDVFIKRDLKLTYNDHYREILSQIKPLSGRMYDKANRLEVEKDFYLENEWRYVPELTEVNKCIPMEMYNDPLQNNKLNSKSYEQGLLKFSLSDINYIFVDNESSLVSLLSYVDELKSDEKDSELTIEILKSRLITFDSIQRDF
ncbi:abortive infection system antitoxin AbiGi family protein [Shewanella baltica]|uniref:abortive infection system antitoxin AbiGi family protein n=1 Tax=Shewanella baltica TaxID=62322 RepID=UPI0002D65190|nr:abortive infection system antitoxin AbiGi family protein [Shewanella baltica]